MSHSVIIIGEKINDMKGDATTGSLATLLTTATAVDVNLAFLDKTQADEAHELLETVQAFLCDGGTFAGAGNQVQTFITELTPYM